MAKESNELVTKNLQICGGVAWSELGRSMYSNGLSTGGIIKIFLDHRAHAQKNTRAHVKILDN